MTRHRPSDGKISAVLGVFLLDDHEVVRTGLRALLEASEDIEVVGEAGTMADALEHIPSSRANVAILDVHCPTAAASRCAARSAQRTRRSPA